MLPTRNILMPLVAFFDRYGDSMTDTQARELQRWGLYGSDPDTL